jgi:hypothetical protein
MLQFSWSLILTMIVILLELVAIDYGVMLPGAFLICFYLAVSKHWMYGLVFGAMTALSVEIISGRSGTVLPLLLVVAAASALWRRYGDRRYFLTQVLPGTILGLLYAAYVVVVENLAPGVGLTLPLRNTVTLIVSGAVLGAVATPLLMFNFDVGAGLIGLNMFRHKRRVGSSGTE